MVTTRQSEGHSATAATNVAAGQLPNREKVTRVVIGVDSAGAYVPAIDLLARLKLQKIMLTLLHAVNTVCPIENAEAHVESEYAKVVQNLGLRALDASIDEACRRDVRAKTKLIFGRAADSLLREAELQEADLIAIRALKRGDWSSGYLGSATCALAINGNCSLLVAKKPITHHHALRAVLALDHSSETETILSKLFEFNMQGITDIMVVSAYEIDDETARAAHSNLPMLGGDIDRWLSETFDEKNKLVVQQLERHGYKAHERVFNADPNDAIRQAMQEFHADLLILGGTGNAGNTTAKIGSVALQQISAEPYPVLMLR